MHLSNIQNNISVSVTANGTSASGTRTSPTQPVYQVSKRSSIISTSPCLDT